MPATGKSSFFISFLKGSLTLELQGLKPGLKESLWAILKFENSMEMELRGTIERGRTGTAFAPVSCTVFRLETSFHSAACSRTQLRCSKR